MVKVKIFGGSDANELENRINKFVEDKDIVDIKYQSMFVTQEFKPNGVPVTGAFFDRAIVIYKED